MDAQRFDSFARSLASSPSRRAVLRGLVGAAAALALGRPAAANNGPCADFCVEVYPPGPERGACVAAATRGEGLCPTCSSSAANVCRDAAGQPYCPNLLEDPLNCGTCGTACTGGKVCISGACRCPQGTSDVQGTCQQLYTPCSSGATACADLNVGSCGQDCYCALSSEGGGFCARYTPASSGEAILRRNDDGTFGCSTSADCWNDYPVCVKHYLYPVDNVCSDLQEAHGPFFTPGRGVCVRPCAS